MSVKRPLISPDAYSGDTSWTDWVDHFEATALVNGLDDAAKLVWLPVRLTGKAQVAWKRLTEEARGSYDTAKEALHKRFEPDSKRQLYAAEFHSRRRRRAEQWGDFADALHCLADKAFPTLGEEAKALLALDRYLGELDDTKVAFAVRQGRPKTLEEAVAATLEMESYLSHGQKKEAGVSVVHEQMNGGQEVDTACANREVLPLLDAIVARLERLETDDLGSEYSKWKGRATSSRGGPTATYGEPTKPVVCFKCGQEGHYARECARRMTQENEKPSAPGTR